MDRTMKMMIVVDVDVENVQRRRKRDCYCKVVQWLFLKSMAEKRVEQKILSLCKYRPTNSISCLCGIRYYSNEYGVSRSQNQTGVIW